MLSRSPSGMARPCRRMVPSQYYPPLYFDHFENSQAAVGSPVATGFGRWFGTSERRQNRPKAVLARKQRAPKNNFSFPNTYQPPPTYYARTPRAKRAYKRALAEALAAAESSTTANKQKAPPPPVKKKTLQVKRAPVQFPPGHDIIAVCHPGLEHVLSHELTQLGIPHLAPPVRDNAPATIARNRKDDDKWNSTNPVLQSARQHMRERVREGMGGMIRPGAGSIVLIPPVTMDTLFRCHLYLGSASRIMINLMNSKETCRALGELKRKVSILPWAGMAMSQRQRIEGTNVDASKNKAYENNDPFISKRQSKQKQNTLYKKKEKKSVDGEHDYYDPTDGRLYCKIKVKTTESRLHHTGAIRERILDGINLALGHEGEEDPRPKPVVLFREVKEDEEEQDNHRQAKSKSAQDLSNDEKGNDVNQENTGAKSITSKSKSKISDDDPDPYRNVMSLVAYFDCDQFQLWLDTSLTPMHRRGYRFNIAKAPLREDLAYAMLYGAGWIPSYKYTSKTKKTNKTAGNDDNNETLDWSSSITTPSQLSTTLPPPRAFLDPFCGSGTLAIEAAAMQAGLPPGRFRPPPLGGTRWHDGVAWSEAVQNAMIRQRQQQEQQQQRQTWISCSDRCAGAIEAVKGNAQRAGVLHLLDIRECSISGHPWLQKQPKQPPHTKKQLKLKQEQKPVDNIIESNNDISGDTDEETDRDVDPYIDEQNEENGNDSNVLVGANSDLLNDSAATAVDDTINTSLPSLEDMASIMNNLDDGRGASEQGLFLLATNPPFGRRLSIKTASPSSTNRKWGLNKMERILPLFQIIKTRLLDRLEDKGFTYTAAILTDNEHTLKRAGMRHVETNLKFSHGGMFVKSMVVTNATAAHGNHPMDARDNHKSRERSDSSSKSDYHRPENHVDDGSDNVEQQEIGERDSSLKPEVPNVVKAEL
ncbi:hypothetical protein ACA910_003753 [Epithemia clementina (nom. ined.)]